MPEIIPNLHPVFVHFSVALLSIATALFVVLFLFGSRLPENVRTQLTAVARWNLWLGAGITLVTVAAGFYAFNTVAHDAPSHLAMKEHRNWALVTLPFYLGVAIWSILQARAGKPLGRLFIGAVLATQLLLLTTAWHGGELVYRYGLGVISLPQAEGDGHAHSEGAAHDQGAITSGMEKEPPVGNPNSNSDHAH